MANQKNKGNGVHVAKVVEISAASAKGIEEAVRAGLTKVAKSIGQIKGAWVSDIKVCTTPTGEITEWRVNMRVSFIVKDS